MLEIITNLETLYGRANEIDVKTKGKEVRQTVIDVKAVLKYNEQLSALSAPQLGLPARIFCLKFGKDDIRQFVNPLLIDRGPMTLTRETCAQIPDKTFIIPRSEWITMMYQTPMGEVKSIKLMGFAATKAQHHLDHLDGILISDVGLEIDKDFDEASDEEREEVVKAYLESLDIRAKNVQAEIANDPDLKKFDEDIRFAESVATGETKLEPIENDETVKEVATDSNDKIKEEQNISERDN